MTTHTTAGSTAMEKDTAQRIEAAYHCSMVYLGKFSAVDWVAVRDGRPVAVLELKCRSHAYGTYPDVYLSMRKHIALSLAGIGHGVQSIYVVRFTDQVRSVRVPGAWPLTVAGWAEELPEGDNLWQEPMHLVPVADMARMSVELDT